MATVAILGGGNGGFAAAVHLSTLGHHVHLYNRSVGTIQAIRDADGIAYSGVLGDGFAALPLITTDLQEAIRDAQLVMVCLPATAFAGLAVELAVLLDGTQPLLLNPGNTGGVLAFRQMLREAGCRTIPPIAETNTLTYICRKQGERAVHISSVVRNVRVAVLSDGAPDAVIGLVRELYPTLRLMANVLYTALNNVNAILHPPGIVLSAAWIEHSGGDFRYYYDAGTPAVAQVMADLDRERLAIGAAWGIALEPFPTLFADIGSTSQEAGASGSFLRMLRESEPNKFIKAPASLDSRYLHEDIPFGLVPMSALGQAVGVATPVTDALITLTSSISHIDYRARGWTLERLGLPADAVSALRMFG